MLYKVGQDTNENNILFHVFDIDIEAIKCRQLRTYAKVETLCQ